MSKAWLFARRNLTEMIRDPLLYIFCAGFPVAMTVMFQIILRFTPDGKTPVFYEASLIPGIMMFSFSLLMLMSSLLVSKDRQTAFLKRLFTSPLKPWQFILGYFVPFALVGIVQIIIGIVLGYTCGAISGRGFTSFPNALLLALSMLPMMIINIAIGMMLGTLLNDKSAPAITSVFISACGVIGGAWMPLDTMGGFEKACGFLPFYESVYVGRCITGAIHTPSAEGAALSVYDFADRGGLYLALLLTYMVVCGILSLLVFRWKMNKDVD